jgi:hypothetical protein
MVAPMPVATSSTITAAATFSGRNAGPGACVRRQCSARVLCDLRKLRVITRMTRDCLGLLRDGSFKARSAARPRIAKTKLLVKDPKQRSVSLIKGLDALR